MKERSPGLGAAKSVFAGRKRPRKLGAVLLLATLAGETLAAPSLLPMREFDVVGAQGHVLIDVAAGQVHAPLETFATTDLEAADEGLFTLISNADDIYAAGNRRSTFFLLHALPPTASGAYPARQFLPRALIAELLAGTSDGVTLSVGVDRNFDGRPQPEEIVCTSVAATPAPTQCVLGQDVAGDANATYWVMAAAPPGDLGITYTAVLSAGLPQISVPQDPAQLGSLTSLQAPYDRSLVLTGPGHADAGAAFPLRLTWNDASLRRRFYGAALMGSGPVANLIGDASALMPFAIDRSHVPDAKPRPIFVGPTGGGGAAVFVLAPRETQRQFFFDVPPSDQEYPSLEVTTSAFAAGLPVAADFYAVRTDFPPSSSDPVPASAPGPEGAAVAWSVTDAAHAFSATIPHPASGRWYIVGRNRTALSEQFGLALMDSVNGLGRSTPPIAEGQYFNPQRSGHGISISRAAGQQLLLWYSYLEDGTPTWYIAQAAAPASGWWTAPLYRVAWNGTGTPTQVGSVELTPTAENRFEFSWQLEGDSGSEAFELLAAADACVSVAGTAVSLTGNWFAPAQAGYGVDVLARAGQQFDIVYFYDALGLARWGIGNRSPFAANSSLDMLQSTGFCPACAWSPVTTRPLGTLTMDYASATNGTLAMSFALNAPLGGTWNVNQPMLRLTGTPACQ